MKSCKSMLRRLLVVATILVTFLAMGIVGEAASAKYPSKVHINPKSTYGGINITQLEPGAYIAKIKSSSKNLIVKQSSAYDYSENDSANNSCEAYISLYAKKAGTYKVTFNICSAKGKVLKKATVKVYANNDTAIKKVTFAGKPFVYGLTTKSSGKFKVTMNKGYKLKKVEYCKTTAKKNSDGNWETTEKWIKIKNGGTVKLNKVGNCSSYKYSYESEYSDYWSRTYRWYDEMFAQTYIRVTYIDKYTKEETETWYQMYRLSMDYTVK